MSDDRRMTPTALVDRLRRQAEQLTSRTDQIEDLAQELQEVDATFAMQLQEMRDDASFLHALADATEELGSDWRRPGEFGHAKAHLAHRAGELFEQRQRDGR